MARSPDDGGAFIEDYELEIDSSLIEANFVKLESYDYASNGFLFTVRADDVFNPLTPGGFYRFRYRAKNSLGYSDYSDTLQVGLGSLPSQPNAPERALEGNSDRSIGVKWDTLVGETLEVKAYNLYMDDGQGVNFSLFYSGTCTEVTVDTGITAGILYSFYVTATNFNGEGPASDIVKFKACVAPSNVSSPTLLANDDLETTLRWT